MLLLRTDPSVVHTLAFSPDGQSLASVCGRSHYVWIWDLISQQQRNLLHGAPDRIVSVAFTPESAPGSGPPSLVAADVRGGIRSWRPFLMPWEPGQPVVSVGRAVPVGHVDIQNHAMTRLVFRPDGEVLSCPAAITRPTRWGLERSPGVHHWNVRAGKGETRPIDHGKDISCLAYSPSGEMLATGSFDRSVKLWRVADGQQLFALDQGNKVHFLAFSPEGATLASGSPRGLVKLWDVATGTRITTLKGEPKFLHGLCYSPDGKTLATASGEGVVRFWNVRTGRVRTGFNWGIGEVHCVAFSPDGMRAAAGGSAGEIVVWDIDDWEV
jgi:WD40 repeat protein